MSRLLLCCTALLVAAFTFAQTASQTTATAPSAPIGPADIWQMPPDFIREAHLACDNAPGNPPDFAGCFINQMSKAGAPPQAVAFTRMYQKTSDGDVAILTAFQKAGPVDMAKVFYPLRANTNTGLLLVNGDPRILDVNDLKKLDRNAMEQSWTYQVIQKKYPKADLWPFMPSEGIWPGVTHSPDGGTGFVIGYPVLNGCHACPHVGLERFSWNFDGSGKFTGTTYLTSPPPPRQRSRPPSPDTPVTPEPAPSTPPQQATPQPEPH